MNTPSPHHGRFLAPLLALGLLAAPLGAQAQLFKKTPEKLDNRILKAAELVDKMQLDPALKIPPTLLARAKGIVILHQFKLGLGIGGEGGNGVAMVRDPRTGAWSPPAFVANAEGSYGFQIGGQATDTILLLMDNQGLKLLTDGSVEIGVNLRATAGPASEGGDAKLDNIDSPVLVYSSSSGLYAGAAIEGGGVIPAPKANAIYYDGLNQDQILFQGVAKMTPSAQKLVSKLDAYAGSAAVTPNPSTSTSTVPPNAPLRAVPVESD